MGWPLQRYEENGLLSSKKTSFACQTDSWGISYRCLWILLFLWSPPSPHSCAKHDWLQLRIPFSWVYTQWLFHMPLYDGHTGSFHIFQYVIVCDSIYSINNKTRTIMDVFPCSLFQSHLECWPFFLINCQYSVLHNVINQNTFLML